MDYPAIIDQLAGGVRRDGTSSTTDARSVVLRMYEEFDRGNLADFEAVAPGFSARVVARSEALDWAEFVQFGRAFLDAFPDGRHVFEHVVADGDTVMTLGTYEGTHDGTLQGMAPTHRRVAFPVMHLDRVVDGQIVEHRGLGDLTIMMQQLGVTQ
jgi:predicted ester cyclase